MTLRINKRPRYGTIPPKCVGNASGACLYNKGTIIHAKIREVHMEDNYKGKQSSGIPPKKQMKDLGMNYKDIIIDMIYGIESEYFLKIIYQFVKNLVK